jgi:hypothetical protein
MRGKILRLEQFVNYLTLERKSDLRNYISPEHRFRVKFPGLLLASPSISVYLYNCVCVYIYDISTYLNLLHDKAVWLAKNLSGLVRSVVT